MNVRSCVLDATVPKISEMPTLSRIHGVSTKSQRPPVVSRVTALNELACHDPVACASSHPASIHVGEESLPGMQVTIPVPKSDSGGCTDLSLPELRK